MPSRVRRLTATLGALVAACVTMTSAFAGSAAAGPVYGVPNGITSITLTKTAADMKRIAEYWSPARLKQAADNAPAGPDAAKSGATSSASPTSGGTPASGTAVPASVVSPSATGETSTTATSRQSTLGRATVSGSSVPIVKPVLPKKRSPASNGSPLTVGKVFFQIGGRDYWCSASSVAAANRNLVATAGHCAYDAKTGSQAEYWIFIPGYDKGETPYGIYVGHSLNLHEDFVGKGDFDYDYAFITVHDGFRWKAGKTAGSYAMEDVGSLQDNVGGQGLTTNRGVGLLTLAFGYPAAPHADGSRPYNGQVLKSCDGRTIKVRAPGRLVEHGTALTCGFTNGASGGPWLIAFDPKHGVGYLNGVNSFAWDTNGDRRYDRISSPYFIASTYVVYKWATTQQAPRA
ncbi:trypsin-like serine peptidase [Streptosporangium sp. NPDC050855]|uniref:trypsin-like serine peptidase n=1 Tax=Streptosporangium sp. NPDC050855 TaxID=3366194 RepID=UPI003798625D